MSAEQQVFASEGIVERVGRQTAFPKLSIKRARVPVAQMKLVARHFAPVAIHSLGGDAEVNR
ncbi:hypothetical protein A3B26_02945 [Candidatus Giovannonibacteria bacterium RIFCSPLOWO2_01_FULL_48_47]|nr:MAG: hypothetical protein A3B26_02945 [Candidatus Giovannonibacteria bacterium RIFCSPLOWO2_01_FULL_48_47]OGF96535.1 MAG: hypothetical protein A2613_03220 [Candidatus Giovannonibacteria bacterium RIFOXYD1_FULL_48_21]